MIKYDPLWQTLKDKNISQYQLIKDHYSEQALSDTRLPD